MELVIDFFLLLDHDVVSLNIDLFFSSFDYVGGSLLGLADDGLLHLLDPVLNLSHSHLINLCK